MQYEVKVGGKTPQVVDLNGQPVAGAKVRKIEFPGISVPGPGGITTSYVSGPGHAAIEVNGQVITNVPLC